MIYSSLVLMESQVKFGPQNISTDKIGPFLKTNKQKKNIKYLYSSSGVIKVSTSPEIPNWFENK